MSTNWGERRRSKLTVLNEWGERGSVKFGNHKGGLGQDCPGKASGQDPGRMQEGGSKKRSRTPKRQSGVDCVQKKNRQGRRAVLRGKEQEIESIKKKKKHKKNKTLKKRVVKKKYRRKIRSAKNGRLCKGKSGEGGNTESRKCQNKQETRRYGVQGKERGGSGLLGGALSKRIVPIGRDEGGLGLTGAVGDGHRSDPREGKRKSR